LPDNIRIDTERDLTPEGAEIIRPVLANIAALERKWVKDGDEGAYEEWRKLLGVAQIIIEDHYNGPNVLAPARRDSD